MVIDQGIDTSTAVGRMFFQILGAIAEFEHALMAEPPATAWPPPCQDGLGDVRSGGPLWPAGPHRRRDRLRVRGLASHHLPPLPAPGSMTAAQNRWRGDAMRR